MSTFLYGVAGILLGGLVTLRVAAYYSRQGSEELRTAANKLRQETEDIRHYINALISYLEAAGAIRVVRDENGRPIKTQIIRVSGVIEGKSGAVATPTVRQGDPPADQGEETPQP